MREALTLAASLLPLLEYPAFLAASFILQPVATIVSTSCLCLSVRSSFITNYILPLTVRSFKRATCQEQIQHFSCSLYSQYYMWLPSANEECPRKMQEAFRCGHTSHTHFLLDIEQGRNHSALCNLTIALSLVMLWVPPHTRDTLSYQGLPLAGRLLPQCNKMDALDSVRSTCRIALR